MGRAPALEVTSLARLAESRSKMQNELRGPGISMANTCKSRLCPVYGEHPLVQGEPTFFGR